MNSTLVHRGPDDAGIAIFQDAGLAMSRLSVIDLTTGRQPLSNKDETCWVVYNGEIYNYLDLRRELEAKGHPFRTASDTEIVLLAYEEWGPACVHRLRGMFAFAIYDMRDDLKGRLFLARDRVGKKPLYYYRDAERFVFASEIKAILAHPDVPRRINRSVIPLYLTHGYVPAPQTMFEGIYELPPGHTLTIKAGHVEVDLYWNVPSPNSPGPRVSEEEIISQLRALLEEAVRIRMISDVPLGAFLSGGLDSTAIVAVMSKLMGKPVKTFAIGFDGDTSFNELEYARLAARVYGTDHHEFVVHANAIDLLPTLVWQYDQPFSDSSAVPTYMLSKLMRSHVTVALTGDGGDELFAGYERFAAATLAPLYRHLPRHLQAALTFCLWLMPESARYDGFVRRARRFVENASLPLAQCYLGWLSIFQDSFIRELMNDKVEVDCVRHFVTYFDEVKDLDPVNQLLYVNMKSYLPSDLLVKVDRMSMANSLEARCPFLDQELVSFAARIPWNLKLKGTITKYILKKALSEYVPQEIVRRKKHGFGVPVGRWFRIELKDYIKEVLLNPKALRRGYFRENVVRQLIDEHQSGWRDHGHRLWALLTFEIWHQVFMDRTVNMG